MLERISDACALERRGFDFVFDTESTVLERLRAIALACRGSFIMRDGKFSMVRDDPAAPISGVFTPINSWGFSWRKTFPKLPHGLKVKFQNPLKDWKLDEQIVYDDGFSDTGAGGTQVGTQFDEFVLQGVIDPSIVWMDARYHLAVNRLRDVVYQWNASWDHRACEPGDRVRVSHDVISTGLAAGKVKALVTSGGNVTGVVVDQLFSMEAATVYGLCIRRSSDGVSLVKPLTTVVGDQTTVMFAAAITVAAEKPAVGDMVVFGVSGLETIEVLLTDVKPGKDLTALLVGVNVAPDVYDADQAPRPDWAQGLIFGSVEANSRVPFDGVVSSSIAGMSSTSGSTAVVRFG